MIVYKISYHLTRWIRTLIGHTYIIYLKCRGAQISLNTYLSSSTIVTWPHKIIIGNNCLIEHNVFFKHDGPYSNGKSILIGDNVFIGNSCEFNIRKKIIIENNVLIASGCKFIDHDHGIQKNSLINGQKGPEMAIKLKEDAWLGVNVILLKGVTVGKGAVIAAGSLVNKSVPDYEIWGGIPAKKIGDRE